MLTGLARKVEDGYNNYWKHIIENHDVDLYLHAWESKPDAITNNEDSDEVRRIYKNPKYIKLEAPFKFTKYREGIDNPNDPDIMVGRVRILILRIQILNMIVLFVVDMILVEHPLT